MTQLALVACALLLTGCSETAPPIQAGAPQDDWSDQEEVLFQQREALQHSLEQLQREQAENAAHEALMQPSVSTAPTTMPAPDSKTPVK